MPHCVLYTFVRWPEDGSGVKIAKVVRVARVTESAPKDWMEWPDANYPEMKLLDIAGIEFVDERHEAAFPP
ncbi:MAG: hypothetical protein P9F19_01425 [Candidatus Contendobacter sp.]|nr:hypothetical protein [Candidatus Contendobacter sp.]MDG4556050.1 hypothetical protein [Candidatus Contendobacter sp.]